MEEQKYLYYDTEVKNDPTLMGWKNFKAQDMSVGVIGYEPLVGVPTVKDELIDTDDIESLLNANGFEGGAKNLMNVPPAMQPSTDLIREKFYHPKKMVDRMIEFIDLGYKIVSFNGIEYDNALLANLVGELNAEDYLDLAIGGSKGNTTWRQVDDGYINWLINNKAGAFEVAMAVAEWRRKIVDSGMEVQRGLKFISDYKKLLDASSYDIMKAIDEVTGSNYTVGLDPVCELTINKKKTNHGSNVPEMYKNGQIEQIADYCDNDVYILYLLHKFILKYGYVLVPLHKRYFRLAPNMCVKIPLSI